MYLQVCIMSLAFPPSPNCPVIQSPEPSFIRPNQDKPMAIARLISKTYNISPKNEGKDKVNLRIALDLDLLDS